MEQSKFLNEVEKDKKLGDTEAAASGAKVLRYYLEFSRDAKKNQKVNKIYISEPMFIVASKCHLFCLQYAGGKKTLAPPTPGTQFYPLASPDTRPRSKSE